MQDRTAPGCYFDLIHPDSAGRLKPNPECLDSHASLPLFLLHSYYQCHHQLLKYGSVESILPPVRFLLPSIHNSPNFPFILLP